MYATSAIPRVSSANVRASFPASIARAAYGDPAGNSRANFTFHGHTSWEVSRHSCIAIALTTGTRTVSRTRSGTGATGRRKAAPPDRWGACPRQSVGRVYLRA